MSRTAGVSGAIERATTFVMGCDASIIVVGGSVKSASAVDRLHQLERRWSRFDSDSEVSALNRSLGRGVVVSTDTVRLIETMVEAWYLSNGAFDPTLLRPIVESGYQASRHEPARQTDIGPEIEQRGRPAGILLDRAARVVQLPFGTAVDPGGIAKGLAADLVVDELRKAGADGALVEIGGDLAVSGRSPAGVGWDIEVAESPDDHSLAVVRLGEGGVATSTTRRRRWMVEEIEHHHLIDPTTLAPSTRLVRTSTVLARSAALAEALAKTPFAMSAEDTLGTFERQGLAGRLQFTDGSIRTTTAWSEYALAHQGRSVVNLEGRSDE